MIKQWRLSNFKSFRTPPPLAFSSVNVLAGANSSGKSSIIQSILLLKQTLQYGANNRPISLNGPLLRLGGYEDVRHSSATGEPFSIGFDVHIVGTRLDRSRNNSWTKLLGRHGIASELSSVGISLDLSFAVDENCADKESGAFQSNLNPQLRSGMLNVSRGMSDGKYLSNFNRYSLEPSGGEGPPFAPYRVDLDDESRRDVFGRKPDAELKGGFVSHFLPSWTVVSYNETADNAWRIADAIFSDTFAADFPNGGSEEQPDTVVHLINDWLNQHGASKADNSSGSALREALRPFTSRSSTLLGGLFKKGEVTETARVELAGLRDLVLKALLEEATEVEFDYDFETPKQLSSGVEFLKEFIKSGVRYLGPLRDSPRPVYQPEALESTTDVGYRGEHTAAVLDLNGQSLVTFFTPPEENSDEDYFVRAQRRRAPLNEAVKVWLRYLGVARDVQTHDAGVYGNRLQVKTSDDDQPHDLTNVGVGVSQVLPIVVMALLAQPGSLLIFEQPELHLHPKVQARLADFFIALAKDNKQTLLETHSEYLVDRLRLRIALAQTDQTNALINIMFSKKEGLESFLSPVEVNEYGAIHNWPEDFFEQSQKDVTRILKAAAKRRMALKSKTK